MKRAITLTIILFFALNFSVAAPPTQSSIINTLGRYPALFQPDIEAKERKVRLTSVKVISRENTIELYFSKLLSEFAIREELLGEWYATLRSQLNTDYNFRLYIVNTPIEKYIPNLYREELPRDKSRNGKPSTSAPLTRNTSLETYSEGLSSRHIALWPSHGLVYETRDEPQEWKFQRPALFTTVEDLHTYQYVYRYLIPMLENSGAVVISSRERSPQSAELIVDNDNIAKGCSIEKITGQWSEKKGGYRHIEVLKDENPHILGTFLESNGAGEILYSALLPHPERYGVTISYNSAKNRSDKALAIVSHKGGETTIELNQQMGGGSWIYLGEWDFDIEASVRFVGENLSVDAVRFGGGMGSVERGGSVSGVARWVEAARYYMQFSGVSKEVYLVGEYDSQKDPRRKASTPDKLDYIDDYKGRGEWVTYLRKEKGIPVDLSIGVHTDAGIADSIVGTLSINFTEGGKGKLWDGSSKFASRDLSDIVQSEVVRRMRANATDQWTRREIFDKEYSEVSRPDVPSMILEMFSHQNVYDMQFGTSPRTRFQISRAIYIGILKFLSERYSVPYTVQPLPVKSFDMSLVGKNSIKLEWSDNVDSLEISSTPTHYRLYTRVGEDGVFDSGVIVNNQNIILPIVRDGVMRSYRVAAVNSGGESFVSETLSCGFSLDGNAKVEVVENKCRRFSARVPYIWDYGYTGEVTDRDKLSEFVDNENPGYGGSSKEFVGVGRAGETLDNTRQKGTEILNRGGSYITTSSSMNHWVR